ncbi:Tat pathway signal sequence domain protein [Streptomyces venezuelae]|uniref:Tat pathway signal sequence domain protein n=1 Tax=Streptomyces venezuelae TaxID=54571 RepID=A0A5P2D658_STRVZ|nr:Tat pathway signal sequence domain protein [Streptomyces venezuelae]QES50655.1 Tat pathway signal sequence domain protein [Streptomyces venezuelae]
MSGIGPVEPGEGTAESAPPPAARTRAPAFRHGRTALAAAVAGAVCATAGYLLITRPEPAPAPEPLPPPAPSQQVTLRYGEPADPAPAGSSFAFTLRVRSSSRTPVIVERIDQPSRALRVNIRPQLPVTVEAGGVREVLVEILATDCVHVARNAGLPFLEVTLSNEKQKEAHSYILGDRYARDLSAALTRACPEERDQSVSRPS